MFVGDGGYGAAGFSARARRIGCLSFGGLLHRVTGLVGVAAPAGPLCCANGGTTVSFYVWLFYIMLGVGAMLVPCGNAVARALFESVMCSLFFVARWVAHPSTGSG
jgi:hypothetical protein